MNSLNDSIHEYGKQVKKGDIKIAYQGLMTFIMRLRVHFKDKYPEYNVSGSIYQGYMDMTFFSLSPKIFKDRHLKIAVVYIHDKTIFEIWLTGRNNDIQTEYRNLFKKQSLNKYSISPDEKGVTSIIESVLVENPNFDNQTKLKNQIETGIESFINDIQSFLT